MNNISEKTKERNIAETSYHTLRNIVAVNCFKKQFSCVWLHLCNLEIGHTISRSACSLMVLILRNVTSRSHTLPN